MSQARTLIRAAMVLVMSPPSGVNALLRENGLTRSAQRRDARESNLGLMRMNAHFRPRVGISLLADRELLQGTSVRLPKKDGATRHR